MAQTQTARRTPAIREVPQPTTPAAPPTDTPRSRFKRIAPDRVSKAVRAIEMCQQLGNPASYDYTPAEAEQILNILEDQVERLRYALTHRGKAAPILRFEDEVEQPAAA